MDSAEMEVDAVVQECCVARQCRPGQPRFAVCASCAMIRHVVIVRAQVVACDSSVQNRKSLHGANEQMGNLCRLAICVLFMGMVSGCDRSSDWPVRPVTLVCPWSAGGGTDRVSRQIAVQLEAELGVPVNVINATGGGGVTGHTRGAIAAADGYTLQMATVELNMLHWRGLCPITPRSYRPLAKLNEDSAAIFVRADAPWQTIQELETALREATSSVPVSGSAAGSIWHLALAGWLMERELSPDATNWISINGSAPALQELLAGGIEVVCCSIPEAAALLHGGEVRCLGVMSQERCPAAPEVPTFVEQGVEWSVGGWRGLMYPPGVPEDRVERMSAAIRRVAESAEFTQFMDDAGFNISLVYGQEFAEFLAEADAGFGAILTQPAMQQQQQAPLSAWFVPVLLIGIGVVMLGVSGVSRRSVAEVSTEGSGAESLRIPLLFCGSIVVFILACQTVGYVLSSMALLGVQFWLLRVGVLKLVLFVVLAVPALYQVFSAVLGVPLPWGMLGW